MTMIDHDHHKESVSTEVLQVIRAIIGSIRAVRIYPPGNPAYAQAITRAMNTLEPYLAAERELRIGVHKTDFSFRSILLKSEFQVLRGIAVDLFGKGIREIAFFHGVEQKELVDLLTVISISKEDLKHRPDSIETILWEKGLSHITVTLADLDEVVVQDEQQARMPARPAGIVDADLQKKKTPDWLAGKEISLSGRRILLRDLAADPGRFAATLLEFVKQPGITFDQQLDQLFDAYRVAAQQLGRYEPAQKALLLRPLAESILALEPAFRDGLIAGKLYGEADRIAVLQEKESSHEHVPGKMHERLSGRIARTWTPNQVAVLLEGASEMAPEAAPQDYRGALLAPDLQALARELSEYTAEEIETFKVLSESGKEEDISRAALHTITSVLPLMEAFQAALPPERAARQYSNLISQLDDLLLAFVQRKDYATAAQIVRTFQTEASPLYQPRLAESIKRAADHTIVSRLVRDLRAFPPDSADHRAASAYLALLDHEATQSLLEILATEEDLSARKLITQLLKKLGKDDIDALGKRITDPRWYFVRNVVMLLGESKSEAALPLLQKAADHKNNHVRQAVAKVLPSIGGDKARTLLFRLLGDKDPEVRLSALAAAGVFPGSGEPEARAILECLKKSGDAPTHEFTKEAISILGKIGNAEAEKALQKYMHVRWWKPKQPQAELKAATERAFAEIKRRRDHA